MIRGGRGEGIKNIIEVMNLIMNDKGGDNVIKA